MNQGDKRKLENELTVMGLPSLSDPNLVQALADVVNGYPVPSERVAFFCDFLNEAVGSHRREMYEALRPLLAFPVPTLDQCEELLAAKAVYHENKQNRRQGMGAKPTPVSELPEVVLTLKCGGCDREAEFRGLTTADAMSGAHKAGWGRGPVHGREHCAECRLKAMLPNRVGPTLTRRALAASGQ